MIKNYDILVKLSEKYKLPISVVQDICRSQFDYVKDSIEEGLEKDILLSFLGKFKFCKKKDEEDQKE
jgi:nucleoid DNA-binding protein